MTEAEKKKREKYDREAAILAHSIAAQVAAVEDITYYGAFHILDHAKAILENEMKRQRAKPLQKSGIGGEMSLKRPGRKTGAKKQFNRLISGRLRQRALSDGNLEYCFCIFQRKRRRKRASSRKLRIVQNVKHKQRSTTRQYQHWTLETPPFIPRLYHGSRKGTTAAAAVTL